MRSPVVIRVTLVSVAAVPVPIKKPCSVLLTNAPLIAGPLIVETRLVEVGNEGGG